MLRVALSKIRSLTLYKGELTKARRLPPIPQLKCVGKACRLFQPDVVRCTNNGGSGTDIDWTCEADLPEKLRFGRVDVSCEGWAHPGDPNVLKGSCGLEYHLVNISEGQASTSIFGNIKWNDVFEWGFLCLTILLAVYLLFGSYIWRFLSWLKRSVRRGPSRPSSSQHPGGNYPRGPPPSYPPPPPPYSEQPPHKSYNSTSGSPRAEENTSGPGFWSGFGLGSLGGLAASRLYGNRNAYTGPRYTTTQEYDWERERLGARGPSGLFGSSWSFPGSSSSSSLGRTPRQPSSDDRGEGPSNLGRMRRSTGYGVTNVR